MKHVIEAQQFDRDRLAHLFTLARECKAQTAQPLFPQKILATLFYEPSTRTRLSFESAMCRLGGQVISTENAAEFSSAMKGESLEDTILVTAHFADVIVLRHFDVGATERAAAVSPVPVINAGDGAGQHPTQALLDLYTLKEELGRLDGLRVAMMGDLKHGRTVRSLCYLLGKYDDVHIDLISPPEIAIGEDIKAYLDRHDVTYEEHEEFAAVVSEVDAVYQTRIQKERFANPGDGEAFNGRYVLTPENTAAMKPEAIVMHPLPRLDEISPELDALPRAAYFRQARNGLYVRMALLKHVLGR